MGACTSKPKDLDYPPAQLPGEKPASPEPEQAKDEVETTAPQEKKNEEVAESQKVEEPLVDLSDPTSPKAGAATEEVSNESNNPAVAELISVVGENNNKPVEAEEAQSPKQKEEDNTPADEPAGTEVAPAAKEEEIRQETQKSESLDEADNKPSVAST